MVRRAPATEPSVLSGKTFDYVVVGGGTAGLSLAVRLSEGSATVAVVEAGSDGSEVMDDILMPAQAYYNVRLCFLFFSFRCWALLAT